MSEQQPNDYKPKGESAPVPPNTDQHKEFRGPESDAAYNLAKGEFHLPLTKLEKEILVEDHPEAKDDLQEVNAGRMTWKAVREKWGW